MVCVSLESSAVCTLLHTRPQLWWGWGVEEGRGALPHLPLLFACGSCFPHRDAAGQEYLFWELGLHFWKDITLFSLHVTHQSLLEAPVGVEAALSLGTPEFQYNHLMELQQEGVQAGLIQECAEKPCVLWTKLLFVFPVNFPKQLPFQSQPLF